MSRFQVRWMWRPIQRLFKLSLTTPAEDWKIRGKHDRAMYAWAAEQKNLLLVAGHTHHPVFVSKLHVPTLERLERKLADTKLEPLTSGQSKQMAFIREELESAKAGSDPSTLETDDQGEECLCYFNSGCCSYFNGDCTGIEIADGEIRLVRWSTELDDPSDRVLEADDLEGVFAGLKI